MSAQVSVTAAQFLAYAQWTVAVWSREPRLLELRDTTIMALGLPGEVSELTEELMLIPLTAKGRPLRETVYKEFGDVIYYVARLSQAYGIVPPVHGWTAKRVKQPEEARLIPMGGLVRAMLNLVVESGKVSELIKKHVRDGEAMVDFNPRLTDALWSTVEAWMTLACKLGLNPHQLLALNREKVAGRWARGTLRGSGNER